MIETRLVPCPQKVTLANATFALPSKARIELNCDCPDVRRDAARLADDLLALANVATTVGGPASDAWPIRIKLDSAGLKREGYRLDISADAVEMVGADPAGLFYAAQTLLQVLALRDGPGDPVEAIAVEDWPHYKMRELMLDLGRAPFSVPLIRRTIRIMSRLKLNTLHLHLNDDALNGLRYDKLPLGSENPQAITIAELGQLVVYARQHHVAVVPEIEAWGHAGAICYHYPNLIGGPGMWNGYSFAIGEELYELVEKMLDEVLPVLEADCEVHLGLDEAVWAVSNSVPPQRRADYTPESHVARLYEILQKVAKRHDRYVRLRIWADHGGRPIPAEIADKVVVEPWKYTEAGEQDIRAKVAKYGGESKPPFMCGGGMSSMHLTGHFGATRIWAQAAAEMPNCQGVDMCLWESNDVAGHMTGIFGGADYLWTPQTPEVGVKENAYRERDIGIVQVNLKRWQAAFPDGDPDAIRLDTGYEAYRGRYVSGPYAGKDVSPTTKMAIPPSIDAATD